MPITIVRLQTKKVKVTRNSKFTQNGISYLNAFLLHVLQKDVYQGVHAIHVAPMPFCANRFDTHSSIMHVTKGA